MQDSTAIYVLNFKIKGFFKYNYKYLFNINVLFNFNEVRGFQNLFKQINIHTLLIYPIQIAKNLCIFTYLKNLLFKKTVRDT